jgi:hypothetical protein
VIVVITVAVLMGSGGGADGKPAPDLRDIDLV